MKAIHKVLSVLAAIVIAGLLVYGYAIFATLRSAFGW